MSEWRLLGWAGWMDGKESRGDFPRGLSPHADPPPDEPDAGSPLTITRRELLKYGAGLAAVPVSRRIMLGRRVLALPEGRPATGNIKVRVVRASDMLDLTFEFSNLKLLLKGQAGPGNTMTNRLVRTVPTRPAYVLVHFQPQSIGEQAFYEVSPDPDPDPSIPGGTDPLPAPPVRALPSSAARLAFRVPDNMAAIPYEFDVLLTWGQWAPMVVPVARKNASQVRPQIRAPQPLETSIEAPWRMYMSPSEFSKWSHTKDPVTHHGRTELWHTRVRDFFPGAQAPPEADLAIPAVGEAHFENASLRAVWTPGFDPKATPSGNETGPFRTSLTPLRRYEIVRLTSDWHLVKKTGGATYNPKPVTADLFMLTALGAWIDLEGNWPSVETPPGGGGLPFWGSNVIEWDHRATQGRDNFVKVVERGCLFPLGFEAVLITITERKLLPADQSAPLPWKGKTGAYLRQRSFILVRNPLRTFNASTPLLPYDGKKMPFKQVVCLTKVTPNLRNFIGVADNDPTAIIESASGDPYGSLAFWPRVNGPDAGGMDFLFNIRATDAFGQATEYTTPLAFMAESKCDDEDAINDVRNSLDGGPVERRTRPMQGQKVAFAKFTGGKAADTTYPVESMTFAGVEATPFGDPGDGKPSYYPEMVAAEVTIDQAEHIRGADLAKPTIALHGAWYDPASHPEGNAPNVFAYLADPDDPAQEQPLDMTIGADRSGGVITPNIAISALSAKTGPFAGANMSGALPSQFNPKDFFSGLAGDKLPKLLGGLNLWDIVAPTGGFGSNDLEKIPKFVQTPSTNELVTEFVWRPTPKADEEAPFTRSSSRWTAASSSWASASSRSWTTASPPVSRSSRSSARSRTSRSTSSGPTSATDSRSSRSPST